MKKITPICENRDFRRIYARGKSVVTPEVVIYYQKNNRLSLNKEDALKSGFLSPDGSPYLVRVGITTGKKIGNAVKRNRSRRVIREAMREVLPYIRPGYDFILVARGKTPFVKSTEVKSSIIKVLSARNLLVTDKF